MRIALYAPLKPPDHPTPSGDRLMARQLVAALSAAGHEVAPASALRSYLRSADDVAGAAAIRAAAAGETARLAADWAAGEPPDLWFTYHPYYKSPDLIGPGLCRRFSVPYVTAESSWSARRDRGEWTAFQEAVREGLALASVNICLTTRDRDGIRAGVPEARTAMLPPFIDPAPFLGPRRADGGGPVRLIAVAMMRPGDKLESYRTLAAALALLPAGGWQLTVVGGGPAEREVRAAFAPFGAAVTFTGPLPPSEVARHLAVSCLYVWPGWGEAYGLAYLEAQAAGLPVVAMHVAGVPEVVADGETGILVPPGDPAALALAIGTLMSDTPLRRRMGEAARARVLARHSIAAASGRLDAILAPFAKGMP